DLLTRAERQMIALHDGREEQPRLRHRERAADAHTRPRAKRDIRRLWQLPHSLRREPLWVKRLRVVEVARVAVHHMRADKDAGALRQAMSFQHHIRDRLA